MRLQVLTMVALLALAGCGSDETATRERSGAPVQSWDDEFAVLNTYGSWLDVGVYGMVWQPAVAPGWRPYTYGQWVWTDRGWMWQSDEPFGWIVYHYGSWTVLGPTGWVWVPSDDWSPARVRWDNSDQYIAWAPTPPPQAILPGAYTPGYDDYWIAVPAYQFTRGNVGSYRTVPPVSARSSSGRKEVQRPPDVAKIARVTNVPIVQLQTDEEKVPSGQRTLMRIKVRPAEEVLPASNPTTIQSSVPQPMTPVPEAGARVNPAPAAAPQSAKDSRETERTAPATKQPTPATHTKAPKAAVVKPKTTPAAPAPAPATPAPAEKKKDGK
ncbi:MAG TPA: DUF6600 domain-containing protein [Bacteroidota bacterium]|nr:DUF6600 domain-containing protein [Bacteroidota bacterium]